MKTVKVSVIIPNYNHARFLDERINSVLNQTYQDFELIILDDKSTDNSKEVIEKYRTNPHVSHIVYNDQNSGSTFKQWEKGINLAQGDYIWLAESDDSCNKHLLEKAMQEISSHANVSVAFVHTLTFNSQGNITSGIKPIRRPKVWKGVDFITNKMCCFNTINNASMAVFSRKKALEIDNIYQSYVGAGDYMFWIEMAEKGDVAEIFEPLNLCRIHQSKVTNRREKDGSNSRARKAIFDYLDKKGYVRAKDKAYIFAVNRTIIKDLCTDLSHGDKDKLLSLWNEDETLALKALKKESRKEKVQKVINFYCYMSFYLKRFWLKRVCRLSNNDIVRKLYKIWSN